MPNNAIIIFVNNAVKSKAKTQLAQAIGEREAFAVNKQLLQHTYYITGKIAVDKYVYYSDSIDENDIWSTDEYYKELQKGATPGERMLNAFENLFSAGYQKCVIIGSDSIEIESMYIQQAFTALENHDFIIGPSQAGTYYLLGMNKLFEPIFADKSWGTNKLFYETIEDFDKYNMSYQFLQVLNDVDEEKELYLLHHRQ